MSPRTLRPPAVLLILALFLATGIGVPMHHHADHDGGGAHVSAHGHGHGHGVTLVVRDMRTERPATTVDVPATPAEAPRMELPLTERRPTSRSLPAPRGRSPPSSIRPRAPPSSS